MPTLTKLKTLDVMKDNALSLLSGIPADMARAAVLRILRGLDIGMLAIEEGSRRWHFGMPEACGATPVERHYRAAIRVHDPAFYLRTLAGGTNGAAESYRAGEWECDQLVNLVRLLIANRAQLDQIDHGAGQLAGIANRVWHQFRRNTTAGAKKNITAHYDLGNAFFALFLDSRMMYSSALYQRADDTLEMASEAKLDRICRKLDLKAHHHLLEIGTGWGGLAIYAAQKFGCRVTTTTISDAQYQEAVQRVSEAGLQGRITLLKEDYRNLSGTFDRVVSIEMVEAVGHQYLDNYFQVLGQRLKPDGIALVQAITIRDTHYEQALREVDFIKRYIFPGSFIPSVSILVSSAARHDMSLANLEAMGDSYARTLEAWRQRFESQLEAVREMGYDDTFIRTWRFYLAYCEGGFRERLLSVVQMLWTAPANRSPDWQPCVPVEYSGS